MSLAQLNLLAIGFVIDFFYDVATALYWANRRLNRISKLLSTPPEEGT